ncbi:acyl-CoA thioesterase [Nocardia alni]|uniref:acyl-CoA thioesterase n=1 Tax=Nocardia alni TaxID=2815723 RepID=UPI0020B22D0E|nr:acyl-CoA thioesterase domain-containing protein [Nocardia alni]
MATTIGQILRVLDLDEIGADLYRGPQPDEERQRVFGGHIAAQALMAAARPASGRGHEPLGLHCYFVRQGNPTIPVDYAVERLREDAVSSYRVTAIQDQTTIFEAMAHFGGRVPGVQDTHPIPAAPAPESLRRIEEQLAPYAAEHDGWWVRKRAFDIRYVNAPPRIAIDHPQPPPPRNTLWIRADAPVPQDSVLNRCMLTYLSDMTLLDPVMLAARRTTRGPGFIASLDHAIWFHHDADFSDWLLYDQHSPSTQNGRGLASGRLYNRSGELAATVVQEGILGR